MTGPTFLSLADILEIHLDQIDRYGGDSGIRDLGLLQSGLAMPAAGVGEIYVHTDLYEMAAAYLFHMVQNHPFVDGNKRTGVVVALVFLALNGIEIDTDETTLAKMVLAVAEGAVDKAAIADFFRKYSWG